MFNQILNDIVCEILIYQDNQIYLRRGLVAPPFNDCWSGVSSPIEGLSQN